MRRGQIIGIHEGDVLPSGMAYPGIVSTCPTPIFLIEIEDSIPIRAKLLFCPVC
jgi:hypothetical protein